MLLLPSCGTNFLRGLIFAVFFQDLPKKPAQAKKSRKNLDQWKHLTYKHWSQIEDLVLVIASATQKPTIIACSRLSVSEDDRKSERAKSGISGERDPGEKRRGRDPDLSFFPTRPHSSPARCFSPPLTENLGQATTITVFHITTCFNYQ